MVDAVKKTDKKSWSDLMSTICLRGFSAITDRDRLELVSELENDRLQRFTKLKQRLEEKQRALHRMSSERRAKQVGGESSVLLTYEKSQDARNIKLHDWLVRVKQKAAIRAKEKEELRKASASKYRSGSLPCSNPDSQCRIAFKSALKQASTRNEHRRKMKENGPLATPAVSSRSALSEFVKFSSIKKSRPGREAHKYRTLMDTTNYAHNIKLASTIYSRKLRL
jgi:hypothetical protein